MLSEEEARQMWCPMVRAYPAAVNVGAVDRADTRCIASGCMMWRWEPSGRGFCGLAGKPTAR